MPTLTGAFNMSDDDFDSQFDDDEFEQDFDDEFEGDENQEDDFEDDFEEDEGFEDDGFEQEDDGFSDDNSGSSEDSGGSEDSEDYDKPVDEGDVVEVEVDDLGSKGDGIARVDGFVVFVPGGEVGETYDVEITSVGRKFAFAEIQE